MTQPTASRRAATPRLLRSLLLLAAVRLLRRVSARGHRCEESGVDYILGLAQNIRLRAEIAGEMADAKAEHARTGEEARRVVGKAEYITDRENPRFVVRTLSPAQWPAQALYEDLHCARDELESRIKEQQLGLFADRASTHTLRGNQLRSSHTIDTCRHVSLLDPRHSA